MSIICTRFHFRRIFIIFQVTPIILVILLSFLSRTLHKTWKSHYRQLQVLTMTFNEKAHVNICSISSSKKPWNNFKTWKSHYRQLQLQWLLMKKLMWTFVAFPAQRNHETFWVLYQELFLMNVSKTVCGIVLVLLLISNYW